MGLQANPCVCGNDNRPTCSGDGYIPAARDVAARFSQDAERQLLAFFPGPELVQSIVAGTSVDNDNLIGLPGLAAK